MKQVIVSTNLSDQLTNVSYDFFIYLTSVNRPVLGLLSDAKLTCLINV